MMHRMAKMLEKKRDLSPNEKHAKLGVLKELHDMASADMGDKLDGLKKVSVMSDSPEGLQHGLEQAKHILSNPEQDEMKDDAENPYHDAKSALAEHAHDESNEDNDSEVGQAFADGGEVEHEADSDEDDGDDSDDTDFASNDEDESHESEEEIDAQLAKLMKMKELLKSRKS